MNYHRIQFIIFLFQFAIITSTYIFEYNITLGQYTYSTDINKGDIYRYYLPVNYFCVFRIQFMADLMYNSDYPIEKETILIKETNENNSLIYNEYIQQLNSANSLVEYKYDGRMAEIFFTYYVRNTKTKLLIFEFTSKNYFRRYLYLDILMPHKFKLSQDMNYNFTNITTHDPYIFYLKDVKKNQVININVSTNDDSKSDIFIQEYHKSLIERKKEISPYINKYTQRKLYTASYIYAKQSSSLMGLLFFLYIKKMK